MRVKKLIEILQKVNPELEVFCTSNTGEYQYGLVERANVTDITLDGDNQETESFDAFIISEE